MDRFWSKVKKTDTCWLWTAAVRPEGYGAYLKGTAHRFLYTYLYGEIPKGHIVHHICENKLCVRPDHLELMTHGEHTRHHWGLMPSPGIMPACAILQGRYILSVRYDFGTALDHHRPVI